MGEEIYFDQKLANQLEGAKYYPQTMGVSIQKKIRKGNNAKKKKKRK